MTKDVWKMKIENACRDAEVYRSFFDGVISSLAEILEIRDTAIEAYIRGGSNPVIEQLNINGDIQLKRNPALSVILDINAQALLYWRELSLTVKAYKAICGNVRQAEKSGSFERMIAEIEADFPTV